MAPLKKTVKKRVTTRKPANTSGPVITNNRVAFYEPKAANYELSNYYRLKPKVRWNGMAFSSSEAMFQAAKFIYAGASPACHTYAKLIAAQSTPNKSRVLGSQKTGGGYKWRTDLNVHIETSHAKGVKMRPDWQVVREDVMLYCLMQKFDGVASPHCKQFLLDTGTSELVEDSPRDAYWGIGKKGDGKNRLGALLGVTRTLLRSSKQNDIDMTLKYPHELKRASLA
jgi:ribA/ribD-fused uncharacterized protein